MFNRYTLELACIAVVGMCMFWTIRGEARQDDRSKKLAQRLQSSEANERAVAFSELQSERKAAIDALLEVVRAEDAPANRFSRTQAMLVLGEYRAIEAVEILWDRITYVGAAPVWEPHPLSRHPAAYALAQIGSPAMRGLYARLGRPVSNDELRLIAFVVEWIDGKELGLARLTMTLSHVEGTGANRENLSRLIEVYKGIDFHDSKQWPRPKKESAAVGGD